MQYYTFKKAKNQLLFYKYAKIKKIYFGTQQKISGKIYIST